MTTLTRHPFRRYFTVVAAALALAWGGAAQAHCDTLDGPVVNEARKALDTGNVNLVLGWVQKKDEAEIRNAFRQASAVRKTVTVLLCRDGVYGADGTVLETTTEDGVQYTSAGATQYVPANVPDGAGNEGDELMSSLIIEFVPVEDGGTPAG